MRNLKRLLWLMILGGLLLSIPVALAQEEATTDATAAAAVPGVSTGVLFLGLIAVLFVGGALMIRNNFSPEEDAE